jgi:endo-beta-N-acetylglucosaminidase D
MFNVLGWKDILRPIRDGYRHLFPAPDTGPTPEERARQRHIDRLKGFEYFDTFEELKTWTSADCDPLARSNTPLLSRSRSIADGVNKKSKVLLCHDYSGGYHEYEHIQGSDVQEESYVCAHLQFVHTFIYFSHKLVCVPPPSWTNVLHRNGVKSLGTLLVEPQTKNSEELLKRERVQNVQNADALAVFPMAIRLADIAHHYGFDGWLINIERPFDSSVWDSYELQTFLEQLRANLGSEESLIW